MKDFNDIFNDAKRHSLSESERISMRNNLLAHMAENPAVAPLSVRLADAMSSLGDAFGSQQRTGMRFVPATLALFLVVGVGTTYAAENALPGDALYTVKLNVNESVKGALALSESSKASWNNERLERRLQEAETLVAAGELTPVAQARLETEIQATVEAFDRNVEKLAKAEDESVVAAVQSDLEASLIGHAEVLVALSSGESAQIAAQPLIASVITRAEKAQSDRASNEAKITLKRDGKKIREAALAKKQRASEVVSTVRAKASASKTQASTTAEVAEESAGIAEQAMTIAEERLKEGDYGSAFSVFQEAIRTAQTAEVHLDASERLNTDVKVYSRTGTQNGEGAATLMMDASASAAKESGED